MMSFDMLKQKLLREESGYLLGMFAAFYLAVKVWESSSLDVWMRVYGAIILIVGGIACAAGWAFADWDERVFDEMLNDV